jgi:hypothetical protein
MNGILKVMCIHLVELFCILIFKNSEILYHDHPWCFDLMEYNDRSDEELKNILINLIQVFKLFIF